MKNKKEESTNIQNIVTTATKKIAQFYYSKHIKYTSGVTKIYSTD